MRILRSMLSGSVAGAVSALVFAAMHRLFISDIWFSLPVLMVAGAVCGLCIGWTYSLLFESASIRSWLVYNVLYVAMFALIGVVSVLVFEPVTTIAALLMSSGPPDYLFKQAMPMTLASTLVMVVIIGKLYGRTWKHYLAILLTCTVLVLLLGLNVSVIGLIAIPRSSLYLIAELFALILTLNLVYVVVFLGLERRSFASSAHKLRHSEA